MKVVDIDLTTANFILHLQWILKVVFNQINIGTSLDTKIMFDNMLCINQ